MPERYDVDAVLFDAAGTLIQVRPSVGHVYSEIARDYGADPDPDVVQQGFRKAWKARLGVPGRELPLGSSEELEREWWRGIVADALDHAGALEPVGDRFDDYFDRLYRRFETADVWLVYDDVRPALEALRARGFPLGVVSNFDSRLPRLLDRLDLARYFDIVLTSAEAGVRKPDPAIFREAARRLRVEPARMLHVGDIAEDDVEGASAAGLRALLLTRDRAARGAEKLTDLRQLAERVR
jgi:putative hydrolase of the HAD superfamily